jgi:hypothetical protein
MKNFTSSFLLILVFSITSCTLVASRQLPSPEKIIQIDAFEDGKILAIGFSGNYFINDISGHWSHGMKLSDIGLEFIDFTRSSKRGIFLIGGRSVKDHDGTSATIGRTVFIDSDNHIIHEWDYEANFNSVHLSNGDLVGSTGNDVFRLLKNGEVSLMHKRHRSTMISVMVAKDGSLIICNPYALRHSNTPFLKYGCYQGDEWEFEGQWYASTRKMKTEPQVCGNWIVEVVQNERNAPISGIKTRDLQTGELKHEINIEGGSSLICIDNKIILLGKNRFTYSLPELSPVKESFCNGNKSVKSLIQSNGKAICLTSEGELFIN